MPQKNYVSISIPKNLSDLIDEIINSGESTYVSKTEFIKDAIRIRLREMNKLK